MNYEANYKKKMRSIMIINSYQIYHKHFQTRGHNQSHQHIQLIIQRTQIIKYNEFNQFKKIMFKKGSIIAIRINHIVEKVSFQKKELIIIIMMNQNTDWVNLLTLKTQNC